MECKKCGKTYNVNLVMCPFCGYQDENSIPHEQPSSNDDDSGMSTPILLLFLLIIIGSIGYIIYDKKTKKDMEEMPIIQNDITLDYKTKGYSFIDLSIKSDLDAFDLINNNYSYASSDVLIDSKSFCDKYKINGSIANGALLLASEDDMVKISSISNASVVSVFQKKSCECSEVNIAVLTSDGKVYYYESDGLDFKDEKELMNSISKNIKVIETNETFKNMAVSSYVGEINPCGEKVLVLINSDNEKYIYRNGNLTKTTASYSNIIYNITSRNDDYYSIYINTDRSMVLAENYDSNLPIVKDESGNIIKYAGLLKDRNSNVLYILSANYILYKMDLNKDINNIVLEHTNYGIVKNIGYKFDPHSNTMTYVLIFDGNSKTEFDGNFETHGVFSVR